MKKTGNNEILEWFDHSMGRGFDRSIGRGNGRSIGRGNGPKDGTGPGCSGIETQGIDLKIEPIDKESETPEVKNDVPDKIKEVGKEIEAMNLTARINSYLKFYASSPSDDMMNKENLMKKIQSLIEELSKLVGSL